VLGRIFIGLASVLLLACAGGVSLEEVPSDPIAFVRQEASSITDLEEFAQAVQPMVGSTDRSPRPLRASVALLVVPTGAIEPVPDAGAGSYPLDWSPDGLRLLIGKIGRQSIQLFEWNRLTGAWDRLKAGASLGGGALGGGPIRVALVGFPGPGEQSAGASIILSVDRTGRVVVPGSIGGLDPHVAPDGRRLVFVRPHPRTGREPQIMLAELGGDQPRLIARGSQPRFSRDGRWVVYVTRRAGSADIWMMRPDGTAKRPLVTSSFDEEFPALSPDGRFVVYASARDRETSQLYLTRLVDGVEAQLTHVGQSGRPVW
jgi:Tol biopolymer transport system component